MNTKLNQNKGGFTLLELLVSIGIFTLLATLIFVNFRFGNDVQNFEQAPKELAESLRSVQNMALSGVTAPTNDADPRSVAPAYGIYFEYPAGTEYILFADNNGDSVYAPSDDTLLQTMPLKTDISLNSCDRPAAQACQAELECTCNIVFSTDDGSVTVNEQTASEVDAEILLKSGATEGESRVVVKTKTGVVEVVP